MDMKRVEEIERRLTGADSSEADIYFLIQTIKHQHTLMERYKKALEEITNVGWSNNFGGGTHYSGDHHADCIKIARQALEGEGG